MAVLNHNYRKEGKGMQNNMVYKKESLESLCNQYSKFFSVGVAIDAEKINIYKKILEQHFNSITSENNMKFALIHPERNCFDWKEADKLVKYANDNKKYMRGHTLIWHEQLPEWVFDEKSQVVTREFALGIMERHISEIVSHYKGRVNCWDVVNEVIDDEKEFLRKTKWLTSIGDDYIDKAFYYAKEADPKGVFFLNDYNGNIKEKQDKIYSLVKKMKQDGVPIDGIGIQGHYSIVYPTLDEIRCEIERYARLGLQVHITELDISLYDYNDRRVGFEVAPLERLKRQEEMYYNIFEIYRKYNDVITNVTVWGVADDYTWLDDFPVKGRKDWPLLFDTQREPKKVLYSLMEACRKH